MIALLIAINLPVIAFCMSENSKKYFGTSASWIDQLLAGVSAGAVSTLVCHPLDMVKIHFQIYSGKIPIHIQLNTKYTSTSSRIRAYLPFTFNYMAQLFNAHGWKGLYSGLNANILASTLSWGSYFYLYAIFKDSFKSHLERSNLSDSSMVTLQPYHYFISSVSAGFITVLLSNPFWLIRTRICSQYLLNSPIPSAVGSVKESFNLPANNQKMYHGFIQSFCTIYQKEGFLGLYKGLVPGILGISHGGIQFVVYEELKKWKSREKYFSQEYISNKNDSNSSNVNENLPVSKKNMSSQSKMTTMDYLMMSSLSKLAASLITYPYQVIRSRLQINSTSQSKSLTNLSIQIFQQEGLVGFYKGLIPNLFRVLPGTCITFLVYEQVSNFFQSIHQ